MEHYVNQAKLRRIINREWPEPETKEGHGGPSVSCSMYEFPSANNVPNISMRPVMRQKPIFENTTTVDARFDAVNIFFETLYKKGVPIWAAYMMSADFIFKHEDSLKLHRVEFEKDSEPELMDYNFYERLNKVINEYMHGVRANANNIPNYPESVIKYEFSVSTGIGQRRVNEDRFIALPSLSLIALSENNRENDALFAVFDGHNGAFSSQYAAAHIPEQFLQVPLTDDIQEFVLKAYYKTNERMLYRANAQNFKSGTTAAISYIKDSKVYMVWTGDSAIMVMDKDKVITHSHKHLPDDEEEQKRITEAGGFVMNGRVNNVLNISRAMGETMAPDLIVPDPSTKIYDIKDDDLFLILASDGITDALDEKQIYDLLCNSCQTRDINDHSKLADVLKKEAEKTSGDNATVVLVYLKPINEVLEALKQK